MVESASKIAIGKNQAVMPDEAAESVLTLRYGPDLLTELRELRQPKQLFNVIIVDCTESAFLFTAELLAEITCVAKGLLEVQGTLIFAQPNQTIAILKESLLGSLTLQVFSSAAEIYDYSPQLAHTIVSSLGYDSERQEGKSDLCEQVLLSSIPVLTNFGIKLKAGIDSVTKRNMVLASIDNYTPLSLIMQKLNEKVTYSEVLDELKALEENKAISPFFARVPFLVKCFRDRVPFRLPEYLLHSKLIAEDQLEDILYSLPNSQRTERLSIGASAVSRELISSRQLEIALKEQAFYGQTDDEEKRQVLDPQEESKVQAFVGYLGTTDAAGVLQNLANNRGSGVLSVEHKGTSFRALFDQGKLSYAKLAKLKGNVAVSEFVSVWQDGVFVFMERQPPVDLVDESCKVSRSLDKLLLDAALAHDNAAVVWKELPNGSNTTLERLEDNDQILASNLRDPKEDRLLTAEEMLLLGRLWQELDGLTSVSAAVKRLGDISTAQAAFAISYLLHYKLIKIPSTGILAPLEKFRKIAKTVSEKLSNERNYALLSLSLRTSQGYSAKARMFHLSPACEVGIDLAAARLANMSLTYVVQQLEDWQNQYVDYLSQEIDAATLNNIIT